MIDQDNMGGFHGDEPELERERERRRLGFENDNVDRLVDEALDREKLELRGENEKE